MDSSDFTSSAASSGAGRTSASESHNDSTIPDLESAADDEPPVPLDQVANSRGEMPSSYQTEEEQNKKRHQAPEVIIGDDSMPVPLEQNDLYSGRVGEDLEKQKLQQLDEGENIVDDASSRPESLTNSSPANRQGSDNRAILEDPSSSSSSPSPFQAPPLPDEMSSPPSSPIQGGNGNALPSLTPEAPPISSLPQSAPAAAPAPVSQPLSPAVLQPEEPFYAEAVLVEELPAETDRREDIGQTRDSPPVLVDATPMLASERSISTNLPPWWKRHQRPMVLAIILTLVVALSVVVTLLVTRNDSNNAPPPLSSSNGGVVGEEALNKDNDDVTNNEEQTSQPTSMTKMTSSPTITPSLLMNQETIAQTSFPSSVSSVSSQNFTSITPTIVSSPTITMPIASSITSSPAPSAKVTLSPTKTTLNPSLSSPTDAPMLPFNHTSTSSTTTTEASPTLAAESTSPTKSPMAMKNPHVNSTATETLLPTKSPSLEHRVTDNTTTSSTAASTITTSPIKSPSMSPIMQQNGNDKCVTSSKVNFQHSFFQDNSMSMASIDNNLAAVTAGVTVHFFFHNGADWEKSDSFYVGPSVNPHVTVSNDVAVAGAQVENDNVGAAYIYQKKKDDWSNTNTWRQAQRIVPDELSDVFAWFGHSTDMIDSELMIVGAPHDYYKGSAYIYQLNDAENSGTDSSEWIQMARLSPHDDPNLDRFGIQVSMIRNLVAVSDDWYGPNNDGAVFLYTYYGASNSWTLLQDRIMNDDCPNYFGGDSLKLSQNGDLLIGCRFGNQYDAVAVYYYGPSSDGSTGNVTYTFKQRIVLPPPSSSGASSNNINVDDDEAEEGWCDISVDGNMMVIGANDKSSDGGGSAFVFTKENGLWMEVAKIDAPDVPPPSAEANGGFVIGGSSKYFGKSVALSGDKLIILSEEDAYSYIIDKC